MPNVLPSREKEWQCPEPGASLRSAGSGGGLWRVGRLCSGSSRTAQGAGGGICHRDSGSAPRRRRCRRSGPGVTPKDAIAAGATYLVVGRPILEVPDPATSPSRSRMRLQPPAGSHCTCSSCEMCWRRTLILLSFFRAEARS